MIKLEGKALVQPTQDSCDHMVNKLESGTTVIRPLSQQKYKFSHQKRQEKVKKDLKHIKCFKCSDMGHYTFICFAQFKSKTRLSRRQTRLFKTITCFRCKNEGHKILTCANFEAQAQPHRSGTTCQTGMADQSITGLALKRNMETNSKGSIASRTRQDLLGARQKQKNACSIQNKEYATLVDSRDILAKIVQMVTSLNLS
jgi:hypothetical protein